MRSRAETIGGWWWLVDAVALGHCSGEAAFAAFRKRYGTAYVYAGVGEVVAI